jgi:hypothetical protein
MLDAAIDDHFLLLLGAAQRRHQGDAEVAAGHRGNLRACPAGGQAQVAAGIAEDVHDLEAVVDQHAGGNVARQELVVDARHASVVERLAARLPPGAVEQGRAQAVGEAAVANLGEDLPVAVLGAELAGQVAQPLAGAEHQETIGLEREVKRGDGPFLGRGLKIDQQVAAGHEVNAGERRVAQQVVLGKNQRLAQVGRDLEDAARLLREVFFAQLGRHVGKAALRVFALAGLQQ